MTTHPGILAWEIPWTEEPGSLWGHRVGHNLATKQQKTESLYSSYICKKQSVSSMRASNFTLNEHYDIIKVTC